MGQPQYSLFSSIMDNSTEHNQSFKNLCPLVISVHLICLAITGKILLFPASCVKYYQIRKVLGTGVNVYRRCRAAAANWTPSLDLPASESAICPQMSCQLFLSQDPAVNTL